MSTPKSVKIVSIISLVSIGVWVLLVALINIFQDNIASLFIMTSFAGENEHIFLASTMVHVISAAVIAACNILMIKGKTTIIPIIFSGTAAFLNPIIATAVQINQNILTAKLQGEYALARMNAIAQATSSASYILNAAFLSTLAAAAIYAYAKMKGINNENP